MKFLLLIVIFFGAPLFLLNNFVMPELQHLQDFYSNVDQIAQRAAIDN